MRIAVRRWSRRGPVVLLLISLLTLLTSNACSATGVPDPITDEARDIRDLYVLVLALAAVVFVAVEGALLFMIFRYRKRSDELPPQTHGSNLLEVIWTTIPVILVLILFVFSFITLVNVEQDADEEDLTIEVTGFQFQWQFVYDLADLGTNTDPNGDGTVTVIGRANQEPELVIPVDEPVEFKLVSNDVIHSFYVRDFLYKLDIIPGRDNRFTVTARETGEYFGQCAELCGVDHAIMRFKLRVVERAEFDEYIAGLAGAENAAQRR